MEFHQTKPVEISELRSLYRRWLAMLDLFVSKRNARRKIYPQDYEALYASLLHSCRSQADQYEGERRIFFQEMASLIEPWFTLHTLESGKQRILVHLVVQCREIEQVLSGRKKSDLSVQRVAQFVLLTVGVCLGVLGLNYVFNQQGEGSFALGEMQMAYRRAMYFLKGTTFLQRFGVCVVVMLFITIQFVRNSKKY